MSIELLAATLETGNKAAQIQAAKALGETKSEDAIWPLTHALSRSQVDVRIACVTALGLIGTESAAQGLLMAVSDKETSVKLAAIEALGAMKWEPAIGSISTALREKDKNVKMAACIALGKLGGSQSAFSISQLLLEKDQTLRTCAANALIGIDSPAVLELLKNNINDKNEAVRKAAIYVVGKFGEEEDLPLLIQALEDKSIEVRIGCLQGLKGKSVPTAIPVILNLLTDKNEEIAVLASEFLTTSADKSALEPLINALKNSKFIEVRRNATLALRHVREPLALETLIVGLKDKDDIVKMNCARALQDQASPEAIPSLIEGLKEEDLKIRQEIVTALAKTKAIDPLFAALDHKNDFVVTGALAALGQIADPSTLDRIYSFMETAQGRVISEALNILKNFPEFKVEKLVQFTQYPAEPVRETLATTLGFNSSKESIKILYILLKDPSLDVRLAAINSINRIGKLDAVIPLYQRYRESQDSTEQKMIGQIVMVLGERNQRTELIKIFNELFTGQPVDAQRLADSLADSIDLLDSLIQDKDPQVRLVSLEIIKNRELKGKQPLVVKALADSDINIRKTAVQALTKVGDSSVIPILSSAVERPENKPIRDVFLHTLIEFADPAVAPALVGFLADEKEEIRKLATEAFSKLGKAAIPPLVNALDSDLATVRNKIIEVLINFEKDAVPAVLAILDSDNPLTQKGAIEVLGEVGSQEHVKFILPFLKSENLGVQCATAWAVSRLGTKTEREMVLRTTQPLINALKFPAEEIRTMASKALQSLAQEYPEIIEGMKKLNESVSEVQEQGIGMLTQVGVICLPPIEGALQDSSDNVRINATKVLSKIASDEAIDLVLGMSQDSNEEIRNLVFITAVETEKENAIPVLVNFLGDPNTERVGAAIGRLVDHGSQSIESAIKGLENPNSRIRKGSTIVLGKIKIDVPPEPLLKGLSDENRDVRLASIDALGQLEAKTAAKEIGKMISTADLEEQKAAVKALASIKSSSSAPILLDLLDTPEIDEGLKNLSDEALEAIIQANPDDGPLIAASKLIISPDPQKREQAINEFAKIGSKALETLEAYLENSKAPVRVAALEALIKINDNQAVNSIVVRLQDPDTVVVQTALKALGILGVPEIADRLIPFLAASEIETQLTAHEALEKLKPKEVLIEAMEHKDITIRQHSILLVGEINATEAIPPIIEFLRDSKNVIRAAAAKALGMLQAENATDSLIQVLSDKKPNVVASAVLALSQLKAIRAIPWINYISNSPEPLIQNASKGAKEKIREDENLVPILNAYEQLFSSDYDTRQDGIRILSTLDSEFKDGILEGLKIPDDIIKALILQVIGLWRKKEYTSLVLEYVTGYSKDVKISAIHALGLLKNVDGIHPIVEYGLSSKDETLHTEAINALVNIGSDGAETIVSFLEDKNKFVRAGATQVLGELKTELYFDSILALVDDKDDEVKIASLNALKNLNNPAAVLKVASILSKASSQVRIIAIDLLRTLKGHEGLYQIFEMSRLSVPQVAEAANICLQEFKTMEFVNEVLTTYTDLTDNPEADVEVHIRNLAPLGQSVVPLLSGAIYSKNTKIKELSIQVQSELGAKEYLHLWQKAMDDKGANVRIASATALNRLSDESSIEVLVKGLHDKHPEVKRLSLDAIMRIGPPCIQLLLEHVTAKDAYVREAVFTFLAIYGDSSSFSYLLNGLEDKNGNVRSAAINAGKKLDESRLIPFLVALEGVEKDSNVQSMIQDTITIFSQNTAYEAAIQLINTIVQATDQEDEVTTAVKELAQLGSEMLPVFRSGLQSPNDRIRAGLALVLSEMKDGESIPQLILFLQEKPTLLRDAATKGLPNFGATCIESLKDLTKHKDKDVRKRITEILSNIDTEEARIILAELISDKDSSIGKEAILALRLQGDVSVPHIIAGLQAKEKDVRKECIVSLRDLQGEGLVDALVKGLNDSDEDVRVLTAETLPIKATADVTPYLIEAIELKGKRSKMAILSAMGAIADERAIPAITSYLSDKNKQIQGTAVTALGLVQGRSRTPKEEKPAETINCSQCGHELPKGAKFCLECGNKIS